MFEVERLDDAAQQPGTGENLKLGVEVRGIVYRTVDERRGLAGIHRIVFEPNLHLRFGFVNVRFAGHINRRESRDQSGNAKHQPQALAHRAPIIEQVHFTLGRGIQAVSIDGRAVCARLGAVLQFLWLRLTLRQFCSFVHFLTFE